MKNLFYYNTAIGKIGIAEDGNFITDIYFENEDGVKDAAQINETSLIKEAIKQLTEYFEGDRNTFDLLIEPAGTEFQKKVWQALREIPYGETRTYKQIAAAVGNDKASRAVGMANNKNPISIIIPCHRVIGSNNKLVGYAGGLNIKEFLLNLEKNNHKCG